jgi:hypothetical protein
MPRQAGQEAQQAQSTAAGNAAQYGSNAAGAYGPLNSQAQQLISSKGYDPATLAAITNAGMGGVNAAFGGASSQIARQGAKSGNTAGVAANQDTLAQEKGIAGGEEAGNIQIANQAFGNQQRMAGLNLLNSLYGTNVSAQTGNEGIRTGDINAQTNASPGWVQNLTGILGATAGAAAAPFSPGGSGKGCWIAAKIFGGWFDPRTILVRKWIFDVWAQESWIGEIMADLYHKYGLRLSRSRLAVSMLKPLFMVALRRAEQWQLTQTLTS